MTTRTKEWLMGSNKPNQDAERLVTAILIDPRDSAIGCKVVWIHCLILLLGSDLAFAALLEERIRIIVTGIVVAKVVIPVALLYSVSSVYFAENRDLITFLLENLRKEGNVGRKRNA